MRCTVAEIDLKNLHHNIKTIKSFLKENTKLCVAVKANAYGHGVVPCAKTMIEAGADVLAVATVDEGIELRNAGIDSPILMLSLCSPEEVSEAVEHDIVPFVFDEEYVSYFAEAAAKQKKNGYRVHIAVDTGMGRIGCSWNECGNLAEFIIKSGLTLGGMGTHLAVSDEGKAESVDYTTLQFETFIKAVKNVEEKGINPGIRHCANSAATMDRPEMHLDMVRSGITCYGYYAGHVTKDYLKSRGIEAELKPVMTVKTRICSIRDFEKGKSAGYGRTWISDKKTKIGVLPVGYADGILRNFSTGGLKIAVHNKLFPVRGRICMDQLMIDLGDADGISRWDEAVLFGDKEKYNCMDAEDIAGITNTISYEITCDVSKRVERVFIQ